MKVSETMTGSGRMRGWVAGALALCSAGTAQALDMGVFGDVSFSLSDAEDSEPSFRLGSLDLYALHYIDDKTKALFETQFQTFSGGDMTIEIQRFWIMREIDDAFHLGAGRFHSPLGYWNRHFHHGILMQDTVSRPFFLAFEGGATAILPTHLIGVLAEGGFDNGLRYEAAIANSNALDSTSGEGLIVPNRADMGKRKSFFGRLSFDDYQRPFKPGLTVMVNDVREGAAEEAVLCDGVSSVELCSIAPRGETLARQTLFGLDLRYEQGRFGLLAEIYRIENEMRAGGEGKRDSLAWFAQLGYRLTDNLLLTWRHEALDFDDDDPYYLDFIGLGSPESRNVFALRYDFSESNALMLETSLRDRERGDDTTSTLLSWAFVMF